MSSIDEQALALHEKYRGKLSTQPKMDVNDQEMLSLVYTPGVAAVSRKVAADRKTVYTYTNKWNNVAVVSDGSRVLGLGNIGAEAAMPVMEGKAVLFKAFGGVDAFPICVNTKTADELVSVVKAIAPSFGGVNLEDIESPKCFEVEERLQGIGIPVMHDDQHGTAIVALAGLRNALKVAGKNEEDARVVVLGAGAAGIGIAKLFSTLSFKEVVVLDSKGALYSGRKDLNGYKQKVAVNTNKKNRAGALEEVLPGFDALIAVSGVGNSVNARLVKEMAENPVVFALTNPVPEIDPRKAEEYGAIVGTGRSDFKNQINNSLAFPGVFRGALDARAGAVTDGMKLAAANALASCTPSPSKDELVPKTTQKTVAVAVARAVFNASQHMT